MNGRLFRRVILAALIFLLLFSCNPPPHLSQFMDHSAVHLLIPDKQVPTGYVWSIDWSVPSTLTLLAVEISEGRWPVYVSDTSTGLLLPVLRNGKELWSPNAKLSPDSSYLAYRIMEKDLGTYIAAVDGQPGTTFKLKDEQFIINTDKTNVLDWSHDGQQLAILTWVEDNIVLYIYDLSTKNIQESLLYKEKNIEDIDNLSWSPDGSKLTFSLTYVIKKINSYDFKHDVFVYQIDENRLVRLTSSPKVSEQYPSWFPKNDILIYTSTRDGDAESLDSRLVFSTSDGKCTKVVPGLEGIESPSWSPDGTQIAFRSRRGVEIMDVAKVIPPEFLTITGLCNN